MRIALFTDSYPPRIDGIARVCELERQELERQGHDVRVVCPNRPGQPYKDDAGVIALPSTKGMLYEGLRLGRFTAKARKTLIDWQPELIHIHTPLPVGMAGLKFGKQQSIPTVNTCHADFDLVGEYPGYILVAMWLPLVLRTSVGHKTDPKELVKILSNKSSSRRKQLSRWLLAQFSNATQFTTTPSDKITAQIAPYVTTPLHTVGFGAELPSQTADSTPAYNIRAKYQLPADSFIVASTTRLVKEKRVGLLIHGLASALHANPSLNMYLAVIGDGPEKKSLQRLADKEGITDHVLFLGRVDNNVLRGLLPQCNAYANASLRETFALSACEAAFAGLPILMLDDKLQGVFIPGKTGLLSTDAASLGEAMSLLTQNPTLAKKLGKAAHKQASLYTPENAVKRLLNVVTAS